MNSGKAPHALSQLSPAYFLAILAALAVFPCTIQLAQANKLIFNTQNFPPFTYVYNDKIVGPGTEILSEACKQAEIACEFHLLPWKRAQQEVVEGRAHGLYLIGKNAKRLAWLDFTPPLLITEYAFFVRNDDSKHYENLKDFNGYAISVKDRSNTQTTLRRVLPLIGTTHEDAQLTDTSSFEKLDLGRVNTVFINADVANSLIKSKGYNAKKAFTLKPLNYYAGISKESVDAETRAAFMKAITEIKSNGRIQTILNPFGMKAAK